MTLPAVANPHETGKSALGHYPERVYVPRLYVNNTKGNSLTVIDPSTAKVVGEVPVLDPCNLYFTPDGRYAIVVAERYQRLDFRDPQT